MKIEKKGFVLFTADAWNSKDSYCLFKVCNTKKKAIREVKIDSIRHKDQLKKNELDLLAKYNQTQGRNENYVIQEIAIL